MPTRLPPERGGLVCPGVTRRNFLRLGGLGAGGLAFPALLGERAGHRGGATRWCSPAVA